jgi:hypothetical protein
MVVGVREEVIAALDPDEAISVTTSSRPSRHGTPRPFVIDGNSHARRQASAGVTEDP